MTFAEMANVGTNSLPIVLLTVGFTGAVIAFHTTQMMLQLGAEAYIGSGVTVTVLREVGPTITAVVIAARVGAAFAAELGTMRVTEQIDALESLAVDPVRYLVVPRLLATILMMLVLTCFAYVIGIYGGYIVAVNQGASAHLFWQGVTSKLAYDDIMKGLLKAAVFGFIIAITACERGLSTRQGARGVGNSVTSAVVLNVVFVFMADFFLGTLLWG